MPLSASPDLTILLPWTIIPFSGDRTLLLTDAFDYLISSDGTAQTVTIPPNSDVDFEIGTQISFKQGGAGALDFASGAGVTIESRGNLVTANGQEAVISAVQDSLNVWSLFGDLA